MTRAALEATTPGRVISSHFPSTFYQIQLFLHKFDFAKLECEKKGENKIRNMGKMYVNNIHV